MNLLRKLSFSLAFVLAALSLRAQAVIDLSAYIDQETAAQLGDNNAAALKNKISKIITRNGMADAAGLFVVTPTLTITDDGAVDTGMTTLHVLRARPDPVGQKPFRRYCFRKPDHIAPGQRQKHGSLYAVADQQGERQRRAFRQADR